MERTLLLAVLLLANGCGGGGTPGPADLAADASVPPTDLPADGPVEGADLACPQLLVGSSPGCPCGGSSSGDTCDDASLFCRYFEWQCVCRAGDGGAKRWSCDAPHLRDLAVPIGPPDLTAP